MEQGQCWMQTKRKFYLASNNTNLTSSSSSPTAATTTTANPSYDDSSWEEQAFAEDAAGNSFGGCIWPPRSYSCSFCRREFRSAQALGGHMNVHRRDRARLKNPSSPNNNNSNNEILHNYHHDLVVETHVQNIPFTSLGYSNSHSLLYPCPPVCGLAYKSSNPNSSDLDHHVLAPSSSPSSNQTLIPLCNSSILHKTTTSESWPNLCSRFHPEADVEKVSKCRGKKVNIDDDDDVAVSLNLVVCRTQPNLQFESSKEEDIIINCKKRRKITDTNSSSIPILPKSSSSSVDHRHPQVFELSPSSNIEELDLELRLGNRSKV